MLRIGIDGGGTGTQAVVVNQELEVLGRGESGPSNHYSVGLPVAVENIHQAAAQACRAAQVELGSVDGWGLGLAGACSGAEKQLLQDALRPLTRGTIVVEEDSVAAWAGAFAGEAGVICIAGTGAVCFGRDAQGQSAHADGLGPLLGDRGSGYRIGEAALRLICNQNDISALPPLLQTSIFAHLDVDSIASLIGCVYHPEFGKKQIAALFPRVVEAAQQGDIEARALLADAGHDLASTARSVLQRLDLPNVAPSGGVLNQPLVRQEFEAMLQAMLPDVQIVEPRFDAAVGATLLLDFAAH